jgi:hypothetical protein
MSYKIPRGIGFENFRVFEQKVMFDFAPLTILTGTNSSGKSSVINGMKLIGESFKGIKISDNLEEFELDSLFSIEINASEMMRRYGTLEKYINHTGRDKGENSFKFSIPTQLLYIKEKVVITYTIQVEENEQKTGKIQAVEMRLMDKDVSLLKIEKRSKKYHIKTNLSVFIHTLVQAEEFLSGPSDFETVDTLRAVVEKIKEGYFYDFSFLWAEDPKDVEIFKYALKKFYGASNIESLKKLNTDIIDIISAIEWEEERVKNIIYYKYKRSNRKNTGLSLLDACLRHFQENRWQRVPGMTSWGALGNGKNDFQKLSYDMIENLVDKNDFIKYIFRMIANKHSYYDKPLFSKEERKFYKPSERKLTEIKSFEPNDVEKYIYEYFLFPNLNLLKNSFLPFVTMESVSTERSSTKGIKSILDNDDFSRLMKKRSSATGLEKEAFNNLDKFLNTIVR